MLPGENGWLFSAGSIDDLVVAMEVFLSTSVADLERMGNAGHERVLARHNIDTEVNKLSALFHELSTGEVRE